MHVTDVVVRNLIRLVYASARIADRINSAAIINIFHEIMNEVILDLHVLLNVRKSAVPTVTDTDPGIRNVKNLIVTDGYIGGKAYAETAGIEIIHAGIMDVIVRHVKVLHDFLRVARIEVIDWVCAHMSILEITNRSAAAGDIIEMVPADRTVLNGIRHEKTGRAKSGKCAILEVY